MLGAPRERECSINTAGVSLAALPTPPLPQGGGHGINDGAAPDGCGGHADH